MSDFEQQISDAILNSIDVIVDKKISELNYSKTIKGLITDDSEALKGVYSVQYENSIFTAYTTDTSLKKGDLVQILTSNYNSSDPKIIVNKIVSNIDEYLISDVFDKFIDVSGNIVSNVMVNAKSLTANSSLEEKLLWSYVSTKDLSRFNKIYLKANFQSLIPTAIEGDYGLRLEILHDQSVLNLELNTKDMIGNPYNYMGFTTAQKIFDLRNYNISNISSISLYFYQIQNSFIDENNFSLLYQDSFGNILPSNLFVDNISLSFGYFLDELTPGVDDVQITLSEGYSLSYEVEPENVMVDLEWLHWNSDNTKILTKEELQKEDKFKIEWYQYQLYNDAIKTIAKQKEEGTGPFAEEDINPDVKEQELLADLGCPHINNNNWKHLRNFDNLFSCEVILDGDSSTTEQIMAFVSHEDANGFIASNIITFSNENVATTKDANKQGIFLTPTDLTNGEYYFYKSDGILNQEDKKSRILKVSYYTPDGNEVDLTDNEQYSIKWSFDEESLSMLRNRSVGINPTEFIYTIANTYNPSALNNTITCEITYNNSDFTYNTYTTSFTFTFGYANAANTDSTLTIDFQEKTLQKSNVFYSKNSVLKGSKNVETFILRQYDTTGIQNQELESAEINWHLAIYPVAQTGEKEIIEGTTLEENVSITNTDNYQLFINEAHNEVTLVPPEEGFDFTKYLILCAEYAGSVIEFPIAISLDQYEYNYITGATYILYRQLGIPIYNKEPYCIYNHNGDILEGNFTWEYIGDPWYEISNTANNVGVLIPSQVFLQTHGPIGVLCKKNNEIVWCQSITVSESAFSSNTLSQWDGKSVQINDNSVTAPMIMAGKKEETGNFTGVMMGDLTEDTSGALPLTGLYGFRDGNPAFGFKEDGTAFIGEAGIGRIQFDGNKGWITSGDLQEKIINDSVYYTATSFIDLTAQGINTYIDREQSDYKNLIVKFGDGFLIEKKENNEIVTLIGKSGIGQLEFNGSHGWITSGDFQEKTINDSVYYKATSFIDLTAQGVPVQVYKISSNINNNIPIAQGSEEEDELQEVQQETGISNIALQKENLIAKFGNNFFITADGDVSIRGDLTATRLIAIKAGQIASFYFNSTWLYSSSSSNGRNISVLLSSVGLFLGNDISSGEVDSSTLLDSPFYVLADGTFKAISGNVGGWSVSNRGLQASDNEYTYNLKSSSDGTNVMASFGSNCFILDDGTGIFENVYLTGDVNIAGQVKGIYRIVSVSKKYTIVKNNYVKTISGRINPGEQYVAVGIVGIVSGHKKAKVVRFTINQSGYWTVTVTKEPYKKKKITPTLTLRILLLKSDDVNDISYSFNDNEASDGDNDILTEGQESAESYSGGSNGTITIPAFNANDASNISYIADDNAQSTSTTSLIDGDEDTPAFVTGNASADLTGVAYIDRSETFKRASGDSTGTTTYAFGSATSTVHLLYNGVEVATQNYVGNIFDEGSGSGASKAWVRKNFHALAAASTNEMHRLDLDLYYTKTEVNNLLTGNATQSWVNTQLNSYAPKVSPALSGIPTSSTPVSSNSERPGQVTTTQIATCDWVYNNYCEIKGTTITGIKDRLDVIEQQLGIQ